MQSEGVAGRAVASGHSSYARREQGFSLIDVLMVVALIGVVAGIAIPVTGNAVAGQKFKNDAQAITNLVGLAKMRASAAYTRARVRANLTDRTYVLEVWNKTSSTWVAENISTSLSSGVTFSFGTIATAPPNTQTTIGFSPACRTGVTAASATIGNTACVVFNSRGLPVDGAGLAYGGHALYLTDGIAVAATTVTATPRIRRWWTPGRLGTAYWREQQ